MLFNFSLILNIVVAAMAVGAAVPSQAANGTLLSSAAAPAASSGPQPADGSGCDISAATPFLRAHSSHYGDHFYTTDYNEMKTFLTNETYLNEGNAGFIFRVPTLSTSRFYRVVNPYTVERFYTTNRDDADAAIKQGYTTEGIAGYVYTTQVCGSIPLYYVQIPGKDNLYTTNITERNYAVKNGYTDEGIACYVLPNL